MLDKALELLPRFETEHGHLYQGDCLDLLDDLDEGSVDMVLTDLPYSMTRNSWDSRIDLDRLWPQLLRVSKPGAALVFTASQPFTSMLLMSRPGLFRHAWVWEKTNATGHLNAKRAPMRAHEDVLVFATSQPPYFPQKTTGHPRKVSTAEHKRNSRMTTNWGDHERTDYDSTERYPRSVITFPSDKQKSKLHPTQKPVALFEYLIRTYSQLGEMILDVAAGSGTTAVAARSTGREFLCMEKDPEMFDKMVSRYEALPNRGDGGRKSMAEFFKDSPDDPENPTPDTSAALGGGE